MGMELVEGLDAGIEGIMGLWGDWGDWGGGAEYLCLCLQGAVRMVWVEEILFRGGNCS